MCLAILIGKLERHGISAEEEHILFGEEGLRGVLGCVELDEREALDGAEVLAWRGVFGNVDVLNGAVGAELLAELEVGDGAGQIARNDGADAAGIDLGLRSVRLLCLHHRRLRSLRHHLKAVIGGPNRDDKSDGSDGNHLNRSHNTRSSRLIRRVNSVK